MSNPIHQHLQSHLLLPGFENMLPKCVRQKKSCCLSERWFFSTKIFLPVRHSPILTLPYNSSISMSLFHKAGPAFGSTCFCCCLARLGQQLRAQSKKLYCHIGGALYHDKKLCLMSYTNSGPTSCQCSVGFSELIWFVSGYCASWSDLFTWVQQNMNTPLACASLLWAAQEVKSGQSFLPIQFFNHL